MIALVGRPNSGKTTLFNWLTGSRFRAVNYPGATVECYLGKTHDRYGEGMEVIDTPGTYSLFPKSFDEKVTYQTLFENYKQYNVQGAVVVMDATQWQRQWPLVEQMREAGIPSVVALTMTDLLRKEDQELDEKKLSELMKVPVVPIDGQLGGGVSELLEQVRKLERKTGFQPPKEWSEDQYKKAQAEVSDWSPQVQKNKKAPEQLKYFERTRKLDDVFLHPVGGLVLFFAVMFALFSSIFWLADPFMGWVDEGFAGLAEAILGWGGDGSLPADFASNGLVASVGAVMVFVPQIFILFFGISFLEDTGYLARAATLIDKPFSAVGLSGRSFVPLLSGNACAVPAMMAARNIRSRSERWIAMFIIPLMTCSARLPVYALLLSFLFFGEAAWKPGLALAGLYFGALFLGAIAAAVLSRLIPSDNETSFLMELPLYRKPSFRVVLKSAMTRTFSYIRRAGPIIFVLALLVWLGTTFPRYEGMTETQQMQNSYIGQLGQVVEPVFEPMGVDWRVGVGLISAFAAREVFVSTLAIVFGVTSETEEGLTDSLIGSMKNATWPDGSPLFTFASVMAILVFFMIALQCMSTFAIAIREMRSWKFAWTQLVVLNVVAWILAVVTFQTLS